MDFNRLGFLALENGDYQEAVNIFRRAIEKRKSASSFIGLGMACERLSDVPMARWAYYKSLELDPDNREALPRIEAIEKIRPRTPVRTRQSLFRTADDCLEVFDGTWRRFFVKGINLGLGLPGYFPGEYAVKKGTYLKWFRQLADLGINALRIYAIHPPCFYEALAEFNHDRHLRLYLFQGIWAELPENGDFNDPKFLTYVRGNIKDAVDIVYGHADLPERPGYPHGTYTIDVSPYAAGFIFGREWEPCAVRRFNAMHGNVVRDFRGDFLGIKAGTPFEIWITETSDYLQKYEYVTYKASHPVSVNNWPTLDPLTHPSESDKTEEAMILGLSKSTDPCAEGGYLSLQEDLETLDVAKIYRKQGGGFFASYHPYPYYPDFMNNDYLTEENPYYAYLTALKRHHGKQPVLVAEFGVPSSREIAHWQKNGWHHGGHDEARQGEINGILMETIHRSGMAGGLLFSWFDEWFKKNWMLLPYELPPDRKPFWYASQDAEENYGLLAAYPGYPGKKVTLDGNVEEWRDAAILYDKRTETPLVRFNDNFDHVRTLRRLAVQHDEGFLYLRLETAGPVSFSQASYLIGLDTCAPETGEFLLPLKTNLATPIGLKFLIHLAGNENSRILVCQSYDKRLNYYGRLVRPEISRQGAWVSIQNETNKRRISKDGKTFYPSRTFPVSPLRFGSLNPGNPLHNTLADFYVAGNGIELRLPWSLLNFTDPSSKSVLWMDKNSQTRITDGIRILAVSFKPESGQLFARDTGLPSRITDSLPERLGRENVRTYSWEDWEAPVYHTYLKESYHVYRKVLAKLPG